MTAIESILDSALTEHAQDDVEKAMALYGRALAAIPDYHHPANKPGDDSFDRPRPLANPETINAVIERLSYSEEDPVTAAALRAGFLRISGDPVGAIALCREAMKTTPVTVLSTLTLGLAYFDAHEFDDAVATLSDGVARFPDNASLRNHLGGAQRDASQFDAAIESFRVAGAAGLAIAQANYGAMLREAGKARDAIAVFRDLLARNIDAPKIAHNLCIALMSIGEDKAAVEAGKQAVADAPDFDDYNCYGSALLAHDAYEAALAAFEKSLTMNPRGVTALAMISGALAGVGRDDDVRSLIDFGRFLKPISVRAPVGYDGLAAFNNAIYDDAIDFPGQPGNERQTLDLAEDPHGALATLKTIIHQAVGHYIDQTPDDPGHPFTAYKPKQWDLHIWATREKTLPYQFPHIHPHGWVSGIYYPRVPKFSAPSSGNTPNNEFPGHVEFLRFLQFSNRPVLSESVRIPAEEGLMVLFPSYFHHGINPFESDTPRMSIAFNAMPRD